MERSDQQFLPTAKVGIEGKQVRTRRLRHRDCKPTDDDQPQAPFDGIRSDDIRWLITWALGSSSRPWVETTKYTLGLTATPIVKMVWATFSHGLSVGSYTRKTNPIWSDQTSAYRHLNYRKGIRCNSRLFRTSRHGGHDFWPVQQRRSHTGHCRHGYQSSEGPSEMRTGTLWATQASRRYL
jgi:hypothetical protein